VAWDVLQENTGYWRHIPPVHMICEKTETPEETLERLARDAREGASAASVLKRRKARCKKRLPSGKREGIVGRSRGEYRPVTQHIDRMRGQSIYFTDAANRAWRENFSELPPPPPVA